MNRLIGKVVFISGASSGIGLATALEFAKSGCHLILSARRMDRLNDLKGRLAVEYPSVRVLSVQLDVGNRIQVNEAIHGLSSDWPIDILVNNAGLVIGTETVDTVQDNVIDEMIQTNVKGLLYLTQAVLPSMKQRNAGHVINIGSIAGTEAYPNGGLYCATKHAVHALTKSLRMELISTKINVTEIEPGLVETEFSVVRFRGDQDKANGVYKGMTPLSAQDIAETIVFAASRPPHVQIASMVVFPTNQASVYHIHRD